MSEEQITIKEQIEAVGIVLSNNQFVVLCGVKTELKAALETLKKVDEKSTLFADSIMELACKNQKLSETLEKIRGEIEDKDWDDDVLVSPLSPVNKILKSVKEVLLEMKK